MSQRLEFNTIDTRAHFILIIDDHAIVDFRDYEMQSDIASEFDTLSKLAADIVLRMSQIEGIKFFRFKHDARCNTVDFNVVIGEFRETVWWELEKRSIPDWFELVLNRVMQLYNRYKEEQQS